MAQRSVTARGSENYPALNIPNPGARSGLHTNPFDNAPWLADSSAYITGDAPVVMEASQSYQPGLDSYLPEPLLPAGNAYQHIPVSPLGNIMTDVGATKVGAAYANGLDNEIPAGLANTPWHYHMGYNAAPNGVSINGASGGNNDSALVSPLGYANPAVAPGVLIQNSMANGQGGRLAVPIVLSGNSIG